MQTKVIQVEKDSNLNAFYRTHRQRQPPRQQQWYAKNRLGLYWLSYE